MKRENHIRKRLKKMASEQGLFDFILKNGFDFYYVDPGTAIIGLNLDGSVIAELNDSILSAIEAAAEGEDSDDSDVKAVTEFTEADYDAVMERMKKSPIFIDLKLYGNPIVSYNCSDKEAAEAVKKYVSQQGTDPGDFEYAKINGKEICVENDDWRKYFFGEDYTFPLS